MIRHEVVAGETPVAWFEPEAGPNTGVPVVLVHGIPTCPALWRHVVPRLRGARVLAFEMVGYGDSIPAALGSNGSARDISVAAQADYLLDWLKALEIDRAIFAGHDLGGGVVQIAAVRRPESCLGLMLTNAIGYDSWPIPSVKMLRVSGPVVRMLPAAGMRQILRTLMIRGHDDGAIAKESLELHWRHYRDHGGAEALVRQVRSLDVNDTLAVADALQDLDVPARIVWGAADRFQKVEYGERFAADLGAPLVRIEGGKHFTPEDHPTEVAAAIQQLIDGGS